MQPLNGREQNSILVFFLLPKLLSGELRVPGA
jgi:hypothetical protein